MVGFEYIYDDETCLFTFIFNNEIGKTQVIFSLREEFIQTAMDNDFDREALFSAIVSEMHKPLQKQKYTIQYYTVYWGELE